MAKKESFFERKIIKYVKIKELFLLINGGIDVVVALFLLLSGNPIYQFIGIILGLVAFISFYWSLFNIIVRWRSGIDLRHIRYSKKRREE